MEHRGVLLLFVFGCTSAPLKLDAGGDADAAKDAKQRDVFNEPPPSCAEAKMCTSEAPSIDAACVATFSTKLIDLSATPIAGEPVFFCGTNLCTAPLPSDGEGNVYAEICTWFVRGSLKYRGGAAHVSFTSLAPMGLTPVFPPVTLVPLPANGLDFPGLAGGDLASNGAVLTVPANATLKFDPSEPNDPQLHRFRAAQVPTAKAPPSIDPMLKLELFWGLAPVNTEIRPLPTLKVPNSTAWPANAALEIFLNGNDSYDANPPVAWGGWGLIGNAHVTPDSQWIVTDDGIPLLGIVGFRLK